MKFKLSINQQIINKNDTNNISAMAKGFTPFNFTTQQFIQCIKKGFAWSPGIFKNKHRLKSNFTHAEIIGIDIDHGLILQEIFKNKFILDNALLLYTSVNHTSKQHRYRILFKLPAPILDIKKYEFIALALINNFNADTSCKDASRLFYGNTSAKVKIFNQTLDLNSLKTLKKSQIAQNQSITEVTSNRSLNGADFEIPKNIEYQLKNISQLESMILCIQEKFPVLPYQNWLTICSSIWQVFSFSESIKILEKYYPEKKKGEYHYKFKKKLKEIPFTYVIKLAVKSGYTIPKYQDFVRINKDGKICSSPVAIEDFLFEQGYFSYFQHGENLTYKFIYDDDNILKEVGIKKICEFLKDYTIKHYAKNDAEDIRNYLYGKNAVNMTKLNYLSSPKIEFHEDTKNSCYFYFKNGFLKITKDTMKFYNSYKDITPKKIWEPLIKNYEFQINNKTSDFETFLRNISNHEQDRVSAMYSVIGYLLHRFKDPNVNKCIVFNDAVINIDNPSGRTGKTLIATALSYVRPLVQINGKEYDHSDRFRFQNVDPTTQLIHIDDVTPNFNLKNFYSILTGELKTEQKGEKAFIFPFKDSPKFIFSSNYAVDTGGGSDRARVTEISLHNCYNEYTQPKHEFRKNFFHDWNPDEWNQFFTFCATCVQHYLKEGLSTAMNSQLLKNKIIKQTSEKFEGWTNNFEFLRKEKKFFSKLELFGEFACFCQTDSLYTEKPSRHLFTKWIKSYFNIMEIHYKEKSLRTNLKPIWGYEILN